MSDSDAHIDSLQVHAARMKDRKAEIYAQAGVLHVAFSDPVQAAAEYRRFYHIAPETMLVGTFDLWIDGVPEGKPRNIKVLLDSAKELNERMKAEG
jgi:hypothetical protein